ncbi:hypothetical protein RvY_12007 [Ramazzottius varieornatus]|uniref:SH2 domain-containing protein n=1 Tax=Ramazzottius varieornatus TaxID=947166 RepID=A0A1D1VNF3_RAMVA|nr:hypothetical protein RvY_12007 [Ramazzottius varieornatus]
MDVDVIMSVESDPLRSALDSYVDHEASLLARQLFTQLEDKLSTETLLLECGRRFCYRFFGEFQAQISAGKVDAENTCPSSAGITSPTDLSNRFPFANIHNKAAEQGDQVPRKFDRQSSKNGSSRVNTEITRTTQLNHANQVAHVGGASQTVRHAGQLVQATPFGGPSGYDESSGGQRTPRRCQTEKRSSPPSEWASPTEVLLNLTRSSSTEDEATFTRRSSVVSFTGQSDILPNCQSKSFFRRRLSFRGLNPFHRSTKTEPSTISETASVQSFNDTGPFVVPPSRAADSSSRTSTPETPVFSKRNSVAGEIRQTRVELLVEVVREALCTGCVVGANESLEERRSRSREAKWEACRLVLARSQAGYLLQIFSPPKANKAKKSLFCTAIKEAKDALDSDAQRADCVFVVQFKDGTRYFFRMETATEKRAWVFEMQRSGLEMARIPAEAQQPQLRPRLSTFPPSSSAQSIVYKTAKQSLTDPISPAVPLLDNTACEIPLWARQTMSRKNSVTDAPAGRFRGLVDGQVNTEVDVPSSEGRERASSLAAYPGYHSDITRTEASAAVTSCTPTTPPERRHGCFLVRASETRPGECVITFNAYGKPKHVRIIVEADGQCHVQSMWFDCVQSMIEHFQQHPLPLETGQGTSDVLLTDMVPSKSGRSRLGSVVAAGDQAQQYDVKSPRGNGVSCIEEETSRKRVL